MTERNRGRDEGASAVEYALIVGAIAAVVILVIVVLGGVVHSQYKDSCTKLGSKMGDSSQCQ